MSLIAELRRRNVFRVGAAYGIVAWLLIQVADVAFPALKLPDWTLTLVTALLIMGFPVALLFAWAFELTPEGIKREAEVDPAESITHLTGRKLDFAIIGLLAIALIFVVVDNYVLEAEPEQASLAREKSIAVLLFDNLTRDAANEAFTDGIHDDILTQISKISALKVIARTSMERLDPSLSIPEIGNKLGVTTVLEGGVQRAGDRVRINVQLIDCKTEAHLWAETYDRKLTAANIFSIQSEIAKTVADALRAVLSPEEQDRLASVPTENLAAYEAYLLGRQRLAKETTEAVAEAIAYFQQATDLDPRFALAHVGSAESYQWQAHFSGLPPQEMLAKAQAAADMALELDDRLGEAYSALAGIQFLRNDFEAADATYQSALELNPNYATAYFWYGTLLSGNLGRLQEALPLFRKAVELDPLSAVAAVSLGNSLVMLGRFEEGLVWFKRAIELDPNYSRAYLSIADYYVMVKGRVDEAVVWERKAISLDPGLPDILAQHGVDFLNLGGFDEAEYWIKRSIELGPGKFWPNIAMQLLHLYRGDETTALEYGRKAFAVYPFDWPALVLLRDHALRAGQYTEVRALYEETHPYLLNEDNPELRYDNYWAAINLALALSKTGERQRADLLLDRSLQHIQTMPRLGTGGHLFADVQIYALQGEKQKTLSALRQATDEDWRFLWWYLLKHDPSLESLHGEPEYQAMVAEIEADMAAQLARVREMERRGELALTADLPVPTDHASGSSSPDQQ